MAWMAILRYMCTTTKLRTATGSLFVAYLVYFQLFCLLYVMWGAEKCGKRSIANSDPQSGTAAAYLESAENLRIFRGRYIVGTLTNNANIIYSIT